MGFNVVTLTDCCAATSVEAHQAAVRETFGMFSTPLVASEFLNSLATKPPSSFAERPQKMGRSTFRTFAPREAKGGRPLSAASTALVMIEFQREFTDVGGKLHDAVKEVMTSTCMLTNS